MAYTKRVERDDEFDVVVEETIEALSEEGFGVLTDVDVQATMAEKLDEEMDRYRIIGACDPSTAFAGLQVDPELGALLPCNVAVHEQGDGTVVVSAVDPATLLEVADDPELAAAVEGVEERFDRVMATIEG